MNEIPVGLRLVFAQDGTAEGFYFYEKYRSKIPVRAKVEGDSIILTVQDNKGTITEKFTGTYKDDELDGTWQSGSKSLAFHFAREILEDHTISCKEMKKYPEKVFAKLDIDLGTGHGSPTEVDYTCDGGGLASLPFMKNINAMSETIRAEEVSSCWNGTIVYAHWRYDQFSLLEAGLAPHIFWEQRERAKQEPSTWRPGGDQALRDYFRWWANQSIGNFELHQAYWREYSRVTPLLAWHYQDVFKVSGARATQYAENALSLFLGRAAGSFSSSPAAGLELYSFQKTIIEPTCTVETLESLITSDTLQDKLDEGLKTALLYQKSQEIISLLLDKGARINIGDESALFFALRNHDTVSYLIKKGASVDYENGFGKTPLFYAIGFNDRSLVQMLIDHKADVNHPYKSKAELGREGEPPWHDRYCGIRHTRRTPLMHAAQNADQEIIKLLLEHGAKLDSVDELGFNAADYAIMGEKLANLAYLESIGLRKAKSN